MQGAAVPSATGNGFQQSIPGIGTMYVLFAVFPAISAFLEERRGWTFQRLLVMPVSRMQVLGGKLLARFLLGMIQYGVLFGFGLLLGIRYGDNPLGIVLVMVAYTLCVVALTLLIMTFVRSEGQGRAIALFLTLTLAPLGGAWWPLDIVPNWMRTVGHLSPVAWAMDAFSSLIFFGGGLRAIAVPVLVLLVAASVLFAAGVARFKYE
jgi:ABC-2 type transport system permease protein